MGLRAIVDPTGYATTFGLPSASPMSSSNNLFIAVAGGSRLAGGIGTLLCIYFGENRATGLAMIPGAIVGVIDGMSLRSEVTRLKQEKRLEGKEVEEAEGKAWGHIVFGPVAVGLGVWMVYLF
jgi:predicted Na+-dependent transporter